jgi:hypothetical protein
VQEVRSSNLRADLDHRFSICNRHDDSFFSICNRHDDSFVYENLDFQFYPTRHPQLDSPHAFCYCTQLACCMPIVLPSFWTAWVCIRNGHLLKVRFVPGDSSSPKVQATNHDRRQSRVKDGYFHDREEEQDRNSRHESQN